MINYSKGGFIILYSLLFTKSIFAHEGDTLKCHFKNSTPKLYTSTNGGFLSGTNGYGDLEFAQKYGVDTAFTACTAEDSSKITEVFVWFGAKYSGINDSCRIKIYSVHPITRAPEILLSTSFAISLKAIDTSKTNDTILTRFLMQYPVTLTDSFFVSMVLSSAPGDTVGIMSNTIGNGAGKKLAWVKQKSGVWESVQKLRNLDVDFAIFPKVVDKHADFINETLPFSSINVYPNPVVDKTVINFELDRNISSFRYTILDQTGGKLLTKKIGSLQSGIQNIPIELKKLQSGIYFYEVHFEDQRYSGKLVIIDE